MKQIIPLAINWTSYLISKNNIKKKKLTRKRFSNNSSKHFSLHPVLPHYLIRIAINVECEFRERGSIPSMCQITDADLGQVG